MNSLSVRTIKSFINYKWKVYPCYNKDCWCAWISIDTKAHPEFKEIYDEYWVVPSGNISIKEAKHIVKLHNKWLKIDKKKEADRREMRAWQRRADKASATVASWPACKRGITDPIDKNGNLINDEK